MIASGDKLVERLHPPVPLELTAFGVQATLRRLATARLRAGPLSPDGGVIGDWVGSVDDPSTLAAWLSTTPGVVEHGLFPPALVSDLVVARNGAVERYSLCERRRWVRAEPFR